jgi:hypothetical protein
MGGVRVTVTIPEDLLDEGASESHVAEQIVRYLRSLKTCEDGMYASPAEVFDLLTSLPSPEAILALRPAPDLQARISELLEKNRTTRLNEEEYREWKRYEYLERIVRRAKVQAARRLAGK